MIYQDPKKKTDANSTDVPSLEGSGSLTGQGSPSLGPGDVQAQL